MADLKEKAVKDMENNIDNMSNKQLQELVELLNIKL